jgi:hypothetical protein
VLAIWLWFGLFFVSLESREITVPTYFDSIHPAFGIIILQVSHSFWRICLSFCSLSLSLLSLLHYRRPFLAISGRGTPFYILSSASRLPWPCFDSPRRNITSRFSLLLRTTHSQSVDASGSLPLSTGNSSILDSCKRLDDLFLHFRIFALSLT